MTSGRNEQTLATEGAGPSHFGGQGKPMDSGFCVLETQLQLASARKGGVSHEEAIHRKSGNAPAEGDSVEVS